PRRHIRAAAWRIRHDEPDRPRRRPIPLATRATRRLRKGGTRHDGERSDEGAARKAGGAAPRPPPGIAPIPGPLRVLALDLGGRRFMGGRQVGEGGAWCTLHHGCSHDAPPSPTRHTFDEGLPLAASRTNKGRSRIDTILAGSRGSAPGLSPHTLTPCVPPYPVPPLACALAGRRLRAAAGRGGGFRRRSWRVRRGGRSWRGWRCGGPALLRVW
ncbi:MAG: hypothetical protein JWO24_1437, partial [Rhodospirillales bacterium]|nr:hypothetical protein [Rhodospirillales bacterium]